MRWICVPPGALALGCVLFTTSLHGAHDPYVRATPARDVWRGGPSSHPLIRRVIWNTESIARRSWTDRHNQKHFERALRELHRFQDRWAQGRFDRGRLDRAIDNLNHLAHARQIHPRDRAILQRDVYALRDFRAAAGRRDRYRFGWR